MPPMMPPGGAPPMGAGIAQVLQQLMQNPAALKGMQNFMQGMSPTQGMPMPPSQGGQIPPGMTPQNPVPMPPPGGAMRGGGGGAPPPDSTTQGPPPGDPAEAMAQKQIDNAGQTWDGVDAPTKNDIQRLQEDPSPAAIKSFDEQFGDGMAEKYLGDQEGGSDEADEGDKSEPEYDE